MRKRRAPATLLLVFSMLWLLVCLPAAHAHDTDHTEAAAAVLSLPDGHAQSCHHDEHSDAHASVAAVVVRPAGPDVWSAVAVTPPTFEDRGTTGVPGRAASGSARWRPGRALLIDLCVART